MEFGALIFTKVTAFFLFLCVFVGVWRRMERLVITYKEGDEIGSGSESFIPDNDEPDPIKEVIGSLFDPN